MSATGSSLWRPQKHIVIGRFRSNQPSSRLRPPLQVPQLHRSVGGAGRQADVGPVQRDAGLWAERHGAHVGVVSFSQSQPGREGHKETRSAYLTGLRYKQKQEVPPTSQGPDQGAVRDRPQLAQAAPGGVSTLALAR